MAETIKMYPQSICPDREIAGTWTPNMDILQFGDGYTHRHLQGINAHVREWTLQYSNLTKAERNTIVDFIEGTKGAERFLYTFTYEPDTVRQVICPEGYRQTQKTGDFFDLEVLIREVNDTLDPNAVVEIVTPYIDGVIGGTLEYDVHYVDGDLTGVNVTVGEASPGVLTQAVVSYPYPLNSGKCRVTFSPAQTALLQRGRLNWFRMRAEYPGNVVDMSPKIGINGI